MASRFLPNSSIVQSAELTVTFINWQVPVLVQACFMTKPWDYTKVGSRAVNGTISFITGQYQRDNPALRRPSLTVTYTAGSTQPAGTYPVKVGTVPRTWWVDTAGNDETNSGHPDSPFKSPAKAVFEAWPGDQIYLKTGVHPGGIDITRPRLTLRSAPGHWAVISLPMSDPQNAVNVITLRPGADYGVISDLEITGGFYYGIMFFTSWENYGTMAERVAQGAAPSHWRVQNVRIHDTGSSGVKLTMKATNNTFSNCEIYNTGARERTSGHGIVAFQVYDIAVQDTYFHDIAGAAVHLAGGTARALLERNFVTRSNFGFNLGFATEYEYMDGINNPALYESINATARNNILTAVSQAGINVWASSGTVLAHNTIWQAQENAQSCILINSYTHDDAPSGPLLTRCANLTIWANVLIRAGGLDQASKFVSAHNVYYDQRGLGPATFQWGQGAMLEDERTESPFVGNATGWARHCTVTLQQAYCDINSIEVDPKLDSNFTPLVCSPAKARAARTLPDGGAALVLDDFSGRQRPAVGLFDAGAVQSNAAGAAKSLPPVPAAIANSSTAPYMGIGLGPVYDKNWPYLYWAGRTCKDLYVDAVSGQDNQVFNYDSNYTYPFKTVGAALVAANQCDRILLKGGQNHTGGFGIFRPNVTIITNPADLPMSRATVVCSSATGANPCIRTGGGLYGGAAAINLANFDVVMSGGASGSCIFLNEGAGSGTSAYWAFYLAARGKQPTLSYIQNLTLTDCGLHGIKLSTFVKGLVIQNVTITRPKGTGIEVRGGADLTLQANTVLSPADTGIRLGGGPQMHPSSFYTGRNFGGRGILLGSDNTEVMYMDVDWARSNGGDWHDNINTTVRNNILDGGAGAGVAFYSARDAVVVHNTLLGVAASMQAGVLLSVSPKQLGPTLAVGPPNTNITFRNNIVTLRGPASARLMVEARILQGSIANKQLVATPPNGTCPASGAGAIGRRILRMALPDDDDDGDNGAAASVRVQVRPATESGGGGGMAWRAWRQQQRRQLASFADAYLSAPGEAGRNPDGSCPIFPPDNAWHQDVSSLPVHPDSDTIKSNIGGGGVHPDFGGGYTLNGQRILYGIPFVVVDSSKGTPLVPIDIDPVTGYPDESDTVPGGYPFPPNAPVEGAYPNCPGTPCGGDRHVLVVDNATCLLYETYRSFPPNVTGTGKWRADIVARFNLSRNAVGRPLGWTSADAAGLPIMPGLVKWEEVVVKGVIDHAIRFTGPNSRRAYAPPATHFAAAGYSGPDAPYMGLRVRLNASFDCSPLAAAARVFCTALKKYGGIFADNGSPWYFSGEATSKWDAVLSQLSDISKIPSSALEVLDTGCLCLDAGCTIAECNGITDVDPNSLPIYTAISSPSDLSFANNIYFKAADGSSSSSSSSSGSPPGRYVDRRVPPAGYDGGLAGWKSYISGDAGSVESDPLLDAATYTPLPGSPAKAAVPRLAMVDVDFYNVSRGPMGGLTDAAADPHSTDVLRGLLIAAYSDYILQLLTGLAQASKSETVHTI
ncbi:hypothetical protein VOLCADRAFT_89861 [Volvox carteri f. nagariensis]|uniref:Right handed beta helix domain-containing protein n=1 Tax=Volvox carteri f. nagariensis TaxID=3068 RepID=D8TSU9_VOLCA|nr:uncharacterized protein VOLCADRAFT_89861 [Volvox carteri f. nagariensis]EFJ49544.1 hypothetical protein VOLCADRAFT_89861 [Volvox carteri f. nagariensis]|eukprot:XP_002949525.1 hypothetical protein VOLCADRAFT_89861 [Volvox carteri f. nagariensis]